LIEKGYAIRTADGGLMITAPGVMAASVVYEVRNSRERERKELAKSQGAENIPHPAEDKPAEPAGQQLAATTS